MDYIRARLEPLPTRADDPPPEPVDWARALVLYGAALTFALLAAMLWIVSPHAPTKPAAGVCLVIAVLLVCAQPALRVSLAHVPPWRRWGHGATTDSWRPSTSPGLGSQAMRRSPGWRPSWPIIRG